MNKITITFEQIKLNPNLDLSERIKLYSKDEVLETIKNSKIYRTDLDGSIDIKLNKNGYKIRTCPL